MTIHHADANTLISLFDDAEGREGVDDELYIHVNILIVLQILA